MHKRKHLARTRRSRYPPLAQPGPHTPAIASPPRLLAFPVADCCRRRQHFLRKHAHSGGRGSCHRARICFLARASDASVPSSHSRSRERLHTRATSWRRRLLDQQFLLLSHRAAFSTLFLSLAHPQAFPAALACCSFPCARDCLYAIPFPRARALSHSASCRPAVLRRTRRLSAHHERVAHAQAAEGAGTARC